MKKAQVSTEFIFVVGFLALVFLIPISVVLERRIDVLRTERFIEGKTECLKLSNLLTKAYVNDGIKIQESLKFNASIIPDSRIISIKNKEEIFCTIQAINASQIDLSKGNIAIENKNGFIEIKNE